MGSNTRVPGSRQPRIDGGVGGPDLFIPEVVAARDIDEGILLAGGNHIQCADHAGVLRQGEGIGARCGIGQYHRLGLARQRGRAWCDALAPQPFVDLDRSEPLASAQTGNQ